MSDDVTTGRGPTQVGGSPDSRRPARPSRRPRPGGPGQVPKSPVRPASPIRPPGPGRSGRPVKAAVTELRPGDQQTPGELGQSGQPGQPGQLGLAGQSGLTGQPGQPGLAGQPKEATGLRTAQPSAPPRRPPQLDPRARTRARSGAQAGPTGEAGQDAVGSPVRAGLAARPIGQVRRTSFVLLLLGLLGGGLVCLLVVNTTLAANSIEIENLQQQNAASAQHVQELEQQVAAEGSAAQIATEARRLGMRPDGHLTFIDLRTKRILAQPGVTDADLAGRTTPVVPRRHQAHNGGAANGGAGGGKPARTQLAAGRTRQ
jgi:hypothetical protein